MNQAPGFIPVGYRAAANADGWQTPGNIQVDLCQNL
jgi:hypothetical protein